MRLPVLALLAVLAGSFAFHAYRAEHPTSSYQSADERAYGRLAVGIADKQTYGNGLGDALHWPPGGPMLFAAGQALFPDAASAKTFDIPSAYWLQAIVSLGTALAAFTIAALLAGAWAGVAAAALVGFYPPLILATGEQLTEPFGAFWVTLAFALFAVAARLSKAWVFGLGGLALGAAVLTRADLLPVPFVLAPLVAVWTWRAAHNFKRGLLIGGLILGGALLAMAPWSIYASQRADELVPVTRGSSSALFVGTYLPGNGTTVGMKRSLGAAAKRRNPKLRRARRLRPRGTFRARRRRRPPPGPGVQPRGRAGGAQEHLALRPGGPGGLREDDAQQGPADVVALRARRCAPHHLERSAGRTSRSSCSRSPACWSASCAAARCCWPASWPPC